MTGGYAAPHLTRAALHSARNGGAEEHRAAR